MGEAETIEITDGGRDFVAEITELANSKLPFTDIRLAVDEPIAVRMPSGWVDLADISMPSADDMDQLLCKIDQNWEEEITVRALNRPIDLYPWRLRINAYLADAGEKRMMSIRRIPTKPPTLKETGLPAEVRIMLSAPRGLILISGATRSGKSTTAAAMIDTINESRQAHIVTIEDPIEYRFQKKKSVFSQREVGVDTQSFAEGLEDAMRQCPDVIMVGEIRNRETAETALLAGESGHLVIGTLHANTAVGATQKLLSWFNDNEREAKVQSLAGSLVGVVSQMLLPKADRSGYALAAEVMANHEQDFSGVLGDPAKLNNLMADGIKGSVTLATSLADLIKRKEVDAGEGVRAVIGMASVQEQLKRLISLKG